MMIRDLLAWVVLLLLTPAAYPLAKALLAGASEQRALVWATAAGLAVGILTQIMFWMGIAGIRFDVLTITIVYGAVVALGTWMFRKAHLGHASPRDPTPERLPRKIRTIYLLCIGLVAFAVLFNAVYWPFTRDDVVALYHPFAQQMAHTGALIPLSDGENLHNMYPMLVPLSFTYAYLASGWENEYLARLLPALLAIATLPAAFVLGRKLAGISAGWLAALLVVLTPQFGSWASTGYTELPMALYLTLSIVFALRLWEHGSSSDAAAAGVFIGLAAWTKNTALVAIPALMCWFAWVLMHRRAGWRAVLTGLALCALAGAPWYIRNLTQAGALLPDTAWVDQARRTLESLFIFVTLPDNFGITGWALLLGSGWAVWQVRQPVHSPGAFILMLFSFPFFAAWWALASYDPRFLVSLLPILCPLGAAACVRLWSVLPFDARRSATPALVAVAIALTCYNSFFIVEYKDEILRNPLMSHEAKMQIVEARRNNR